MFNLFGAKMIFFSWSCLVLCKRKKYKLLFNTDIHLKKISKSTRSGDILVGILSLELMFSMSMKYPKKVMLKKSYED